MLSDKKLAPALRVLPQDATGVFKDSYLLDFLDLPERLSEADQQTSLLRNLRKFLMELGDGFAFVGEKVRVQVGDQDFELDLLFYHRDLQCLVAFELKTGRFEPEHMGKLAFYLEALDRDRKRPHENPSIGVLLCRSKNDEVVEYAMKHTRGTTQTGFGAPQDQPLCGGGLSPPHLFPKLLINLQPQHWKRLQLAPYLHIPRRLARLAH